ncbi:hypothetical protein NKI86_31060 [Mesorhizobium sp. M0320]|uniref:hypothetical protein n=1 Tax=Mesorhizobium sp. M0320 TaxID=2956936 RepID=UPI003337127F
MDIPIHLYRVRRPGLFQAIKKPYHHNFAGQELTSSENPTASAAARIEDCNVAGIDPPCAADVVSQNRNTTLIMRVWHDHFLPWRLALNLSANLSRYSSFPMKEFKVRANLGVEPHKKF